MNLRTLAVVAARMEARRHRVNTQSYPRQTHCISTAPISSPLHGLHSTLRLPRLQQPLKTHQVPQRLPKAQALIPLPPNRLRKHLPLALILESLINSFVSSPVLLFTNTSTGENFTEPLVVTTSRVMSHRNSEARNAQRVPERFERVVKME